MKSNDRVAYRYSSGFVLRKLMLLASMFLVGWAILWVINYDGLANDSTVTTTTPPVDTTEKEVDSNPVDEVDSDVDAIDEITEKEDDSTIEGADDSDTQPQESAPADSGLPFTITSDIGEPSISGTGDDAVYSYNLDNKALVEVSLNPTKLKGADFTWTHVLNDPPATLKLQDTPTAFCQPASSTCTIGNGILEINVVADSESKHDYYVRIRDQFDNDRTTALNFYKPILESIKINN